MTPSPTVCLDFMAAFDKALSNGSFVSITLTDYQGQEEALRQILIRRVVIKRTEKFAFTYRYKTRDIVKNYPLPEGRARIAEMLAHDFRNVTLFTTAFDLRLRNGKMKELSPSHTTPPPLTNDIPKERLISSEGKPYLYALGITNADGHVLKAAQDKFRQINKYVEIMAGLVKDIPLELPLSIADMGSGKGYLTFALYDYLTGVGFDPRVTGVEYRPDLVTLCNTIARSSHFDGLSFVQGSIADFDPAGLTVLIALHACDTATDDAIAKGIAAGADLIVTAPCCHKQVRREMEAHGTAAEIDFLMTYGTFKERQAEMVTDGLRALILNYFGYSTKVFEFISDAHTPKNVMIVGRKTSGTPPNQPQILDKIREAKAFFGVHTHYLERLTGLDTANA